MSNFEWSFVLGKTTSFCMWLPKFLYISAQLACCCTAAGGPVQSKLSTRQWAEDNKYNVEKIFTKVLNTPSAHTLDHCKTCVPPVGVCPAVPNRHRVSTDHETAVGEENSPHTSLSSSTHLLFRQYVIMQCTHTTVGKKLSTKDTL